MAYHNSLLQGVRKAAGRHCKQKLLDARHEKTHIYTDTYCTYKHIQKAVRASYHKNSNKTAPFFSTVKDKKLVHAFGAYRYAAKVTLQSLNFLLTTLYIYIYRVQMLA